MTRGNYNELRGWETPANENAADEGYHVVYPDGYESWCPKAQFEAAGRPIDGMTFGQAIEAMKQGKIKLTEDKEKGSFAGGIVLRGKDCDKNLSLEVEIENLRSDEDVCAKALFS